MQKTTEEALNYENLKEAIKLSRAGWGYITRACIKNCPREFLIEELRKKKIIESFYDEENDKFKFRETIKKQ